MSEESKIKRRRKRTINLQMTTISWCLEFITGMLSMIMRHFKFNKYGPAVGFFFLVDVCLNLIVIPSFYILNNDDFKQRIISEGWFKWFTNFHRSSRVEPARNEDLEAPIA